MHLYCDDMPATASSHADLPKHDHPPSLYSPLGVNLTAPVTAGTRLMPRPQPFEDASEGRKSVIPQ